VRRRTADAPIAVTALVFIQRKLGQQVRPVASDDAAGGPRRRRLKEHIQDQGCDCGDHEYDQNIQNPDRDQSEALPASQLLVAAALEFIELVGLSHAASLTVTARDIYDCDSDDLWHRYHRSESPLFRLA
jgi:hypothetical protein